jgi:hypothetical protein
MHVGSNYLELKGPADLGDGEYYSDSTYVRRVHFDNFFKQLRRELNPDACINARVQHYQQAANALLEDIKALTASLGLAQQKALPGSASTGLAVLNAVVDIKGYQVSLSEAKETQLPALFNGVKEANKAMCSWLQVSSLPMLALATGMTDSIKEIDGRIFNISLYAGLTEEVVQCCGGEPAAMNEKLHVMQRMLFMDEECLLGYQTGGFEFRDIAKFDDWVSEPVNRDRILPYARCIVAMRVRRNKKERDWDGSLSNLLTNINISISDKFTFLYIRNGERVFRLSCDLEFDELIFPDRSVFDPAVPMMAEMGGDKVRKLITRDDFENRIAEYKLNAKLFDQWEQDNPTETWDHTKGMSRWYANPYRNFESMGINPDSIAKEWEPFDPSSVYYDDILESVSDTIKKYNRIATIVQGLFDRSEVLHPHPPVKTWTTDGFNASVTLVYDKSRALMYGDAPDIQAYIHKCNATLDADSIVIGQDQYWCKKEAKKECDRLDNDYRNKSEWRPKTFRPYGNPGPGHISRMASWKAKSREATFTWYRERQRENCGRHNGILTKITVPAAELFNVSAYVPGDFRQFFQDPRTRAEYLRWAGMLIAAEEYWAGNLQVQEPAEIRNED